MVTGGFSDSCASELWATRMRLRAKVRILSMALKDEGRGKKWEGGLEFKGK
jgi:hypothetical protein